MRRLIIEKPGKIGFTEFKLESLGETQALARTLYSGLSKLGKDKIQALMP